MIQIRLDSAISLTEQLQQELRGAIARGELSPGDPLPPVRQLAADLGINWNTVARAYRALELEGLVNSSRGRGTVVTSATDHSAKGDAVQRVQDGLARAMADAKLGGMPRETLQQLVHKLLQSTYPE